MSEKYKKVYKNGTTYHMSETGACRDIDVEDWVEEVSFGEDVTKIWLRKNSKKRFENVKRIHIGKNVYSIEMPNTVFPNVREVISDRESFPAGRMLTERTSIGKIDLNKTTLLNAFCLKPEEPLDLSGIWGIRTGALVGCYSEKVINSEQIEMVKKSDFLNESNICIEDRTATCGVRMVGSIVVDISDSKDYMIYGAVVKNVFFEDTSHISLADIENMRGINIEFSKKNPEYSSKDGLVYSKDMKMLISCSHSKSGKVVIADGVEEIRANAFAYRDMIESVYIPDSVERIGANAFTNCDNLKSVVFGNSIKSIGAFAFYCCSNLRQVEFPNSLKRIEAHAFDACNELRHLKLNEGLEYIGTGAFDGGKIRHAKLPSNTKVSKGSLSGIQRVELPDERIPGNITSAIIGGYPQLFDDMKNIPLRMDTATDDGLVYCLKTPTRKIVIPVTLKCSENKRRRFQAESKKLVNGEPHNFFKCCSTLQQQIAVAYMEYENQPTEESRKFLKGYGKELTKVMLEQHMEKELTDLIRKDLFSCVMLEEMYCISSDMGANVVSAYIMNKLACEDKKELDFAI